MAKMVTVLNPLPYPMVLIPAATASGEPGNPETPAPTPTLMSWVNQNPVAGTDGAPDTVVLTSTNRYVKTKITAVPANGLVVTIPVLSAEKPEMSWQFTPAIADEGVLTFTFQVGSADIVLEKDIPAGWSSMLFDFYWDGEQVRCTQRICTDHMLNYQA